MKKALAWVTAALCVATISCAGAQSAGAMDDLLFEERATWGNVVAFVMQSRGLVPPGASGEEALAALDSEGWGLAQHPALQPATLGGVSHLLMRVFAMRGGLLYSIAPGPRYAARELSFLGLVRGYTGPGRAVSGREVVQLLGDVAAWNEART